MMNDCDSQLISCWPPEAEDIVTDVKSGPLHDHKNSYKRPLQCGESTEFVKKKRNMKSPDICMATPAVARWWRKNKQMLHKKYSNEIPESCSPNTQLNHIFRLPETMMFMRQRIEVLSDMQHQSDSCLILAVMGSFYEKLGELNNASKCFTEAGQSSAGTDPSTVNEYKWFLHRIEKKLLINKLQKEKFNLLPIETSSCLPKSEPVERRSVDDLSVREFMLNYAMTSTPVIITGLTSLMTPKIWNLQHIRNVAGKCLVKPRRLFHGSVEWAQLEEDTQTMTVEKFIDIIRERQEKNIYLFDWSLPLNCPELLEDFKIPKYFAGDLLQRTEPGTLYRDSWPSLFVAPSGMRSELHVDAFGSNFWMALFTGQKRWLFFPKDDLPLLYPDYSHSMDPTFSVDLSQPDLEKHPLLSLTRPMECVLKPGEVLFVPAGCPHRVENLETSVAISANIVDRSNFKLVKSELIINSLIDSRSADLLTQVENKEFPTEDAQLSS